ncbi:C-mannosyltransferase dpy-19 [Nomia melanderi]|uniref:C-mannosyltransferase dpy-19 n=1 Tax=Nomia melanderi TaxID=2448451 RepID=UPI0013045C60|nr:C-mannosyltransferase dpy-19 [Nomia melanderi]
MTRIVALILGHVIKTDQLLKMATNGDSETRVYKFAVTVIGWVIGIFHRWHVSTLFENDRHFSHLSEIEREMSFRTEMGMYYSYFKTIAESETFMEGWRKIRHDNISEYGHVINASAKYNLLPELLIGWLYHWSKNLEIISITECWTIERGENVPPVISCAGLAVPVYFYLGYVWFSAMCTAAILFYYSVYLSNSLFGGIITTLLFFYNHNECTRVQWTPPLRESFAYPMILYQMYLLTVLLREGNRQTWKKIPPLLFLKMCSAIMLSLCCWQFTHFVYSTQIIALLILKWMKVISNDFCMLICLCHAGPAFIATRLLSDDSTLLYSLYMCLLMATIINFELPERPTQYLGVNLETPIEIVLVVVSTVLLKFYLAFEDDAHVYNLLKAKLTNYRDFHTMLYTCSAEFDFLPFRSYEILIKTSLLPIAVLAGILILYYWYRNYKVRGYLTAIEPEVAYNGLQTVAFIIMAVFIMRLKLFMNPQLCIVAGTICASRYLEKVGLKGNKMRTAVVVLLISAMSYHGIDRFREERSIMGEFMNLEQEELFEWIKNNTPKDAVFAGKMSLMANLMLSTGRPIVNNPYYESKEMRNRTLQVYEIFSRKDEPSVYLTLRKMGVNYVVLEEPLCFAYANLPSGCQMIDLWDMVDNGTAKAAGKPALCPMLFQGMSYFFTRTFVSRRYVVLQLEYPQYIELKPTTSIQYAYR